MKLNIYLAAAQLVAQCIINAIKLLPEDPALGHVGRVHGTRELVAADTRYIVPYRVRPRLQQIEILRVFHTSRRLPKNGKAILFVSVLKSSRRPN